MKKKMKSVALMLTALTMIVSLFGCGASDTGEKGTTAQTAAENTTAAAPTEASAPKLTGKIVFATHRTDKADNTLTDIAKEFMAQNPGTEVEVDPVMDASTTLSTRMAAGEAPDVYLMVSGIKTTHYPQYFAPLDDLGYNDDNAFVKKGADGKIYSLISTISYDGIIYNKNVFRDCGITQVPATLTDFYSACEKIKAKGIVPIASNFKDDWTLTWFTYIYAVNKTGNSNFLNELTGKDLLPEGSEIVESMNILRTLNEKGYLEKDLTSTNWDGFKKDMATGKIAMSYMGTWLPSQIVDNGAKAEDIGMFPFPESKALFYGPDMAFVVNAQSKYLETSKAFLKFMWDESRYAKAIGALSPLKNVKQDSAFVNELLSFNLPIIPIADSTDDYTAINSDTQLNWGTLCQEYMLAKNPADIIEKYNKKWADSRKKLGF